MNFCTNCGQKLEPLWRVCPQCGKALSTPVKQPYKTEAMIEEPTWFDNYGFGVIAMMLLIPLSSTILLMSYVMFFIGIFLLPHASIFSIIAIIIDKKRAVGIASLVISGFFLAFFIIILGY